LVEVGGIIGGVGDSEMVLGAQFIVVINKDALGAIWTAAAEEMMGQKNNRGNCTMLSQPTTPTMSTLSSVALGLGGWMYLCHSTKKRSLTWVDWLGKRVGKT
jgi:hypothetical protein